MIGTVSRVELNLCVVTSDTGGVVEDGITAEGSVVMNAERKRDIFLQCRDLEPRLPERAQ